MLRMPPSPKPWSQRPSWPRRASKTVIREDGSRAGTAAVQATEFWRRVSETKGHSPNLYSIFSRSLTRFDASHLRADHKTAALISIDRITVASQTKTAHLHGL